ASWGSMTTSETSPSKTPWSLPGATGQLAPPSVLRCNPFSPATNTRLGLPGSTATSAQVVLEIGPQRRQCSPPSPVRYTPTPRVTGPTGQPTPPVHSPVAA